MNVPSSGRSSASLRLLAAGAVAAAGVGVLAVVVGVLSLGPVPTGALWPALAAGLVAVVVTAVSAAVLAPPLLRSSAEMTALAAGLTAMSGRARLAEQAGEQARRTADAASTGMAELLAGLVAAEEGARGQLAAELHDTVAQSLARARMLLAAGQPDQAAESLDEAEDQVRGVMARTRPPGLRGGDLAAAMSMLRDDLSRRYGLSVTLEWPPESRPLPLAGAVTVYRFFQEGLLNVAKHSDTGEATARLVFVGAGLLAEVRDDGPGFDPAAVRARDGRQVGLGLLAERARLAGGALRVDAKPGGGVTLRLQLPVPEAAATTPVPPAGSATPGLPAGSEQRPSYSR